MSDVSIVVVTYNALPWLEQALESVRGYETVVVDHESTDGTVELVRDRFPDVRLVRQENRGLAYGWNTGVRETSGRYVLLLNSDAWMDDGAVDALAAFADAHPEAAVVGPRLRYPDGRLQRSVRGFPTLWRLATEFFYLRKLAPGTQVLNAFYAGGFDHDRDCEAEWIMGAVWLVRRAAIEEVGPADDSFFLFSEETDWAWRFRDAGWQVHFVAGAGATHVYGGAHQGRMLAENVKSQLRFLRKHRGDRYANAAALIIRAGLLFRGRRP